jgi:hypothetical protein
MYVKAARAIVATQQLVSFCDAIFVGRSATDYLLQLFGIPGPLHSDLRGGTVDLPEIIGDQFNSSCSEVLVQPMQFRVAPGIDTIHGVWTGALCCLPVAPATQQARR